MIKGEEGFFAVLRFRDIVDDAFANGPLFHSRDLSRAQPLLLNLSPSAFLSSSLDTAWRRPLWTSDETQTPGTVA